MSRHLGSVSILVSLAFFYSAAAEQDVGQSELALLGSWSKACDAWGTPAICTTDWRPGLHPNQIVQEYSVVGQGDQKLLFSGRGVYRIKSERVDGFWEDSQGAIHPLAGDYKDGTISVLWGTPGTEIGRSQYIYKNDTLTVRDYLLSEQGWREFMVVEYQRRIN